VEKRLKFFRSSRPYEFDCYVGLFSQCGKYKSHALRQFLYYLLFPVFDGIDVEDNLEHVMLLQYAMILLGAYKMIPRNIFIMETNGPKKLVFKNYTLSNKFTNNVCLMKDGSVVVCANFKSRDNSLFLIGQTFNKLECPFRKPYVATDFYIYRASDLCKQQAVWPVKDISAKYYDLPLHPVETPGIYNPKQNWYLSPLLHIMNILLSFIIKKVLHNTKCNADLFSTTVIPLLAISTTRYYLAITA